MVFGFGKKNKGVTAAVNKISGQTDKLEAFIAADVLVAHSEGGVSKEEKAVIFKKITSSKVLSGFSAGDMQKTLDRMIERMDSGGRGAKKELMDEIVQAIDRDDDIAEAMILDCIDIADDSPERDGSGIGDREGKMLDEISKKIGISDWRQHV